MDSKFGKLKIQFFVNLASEDEHGRQRGKYVTLWTRYELTLDEAEQAARKFIECNALLQRSEINKRESALCVQWIPNAEHIYI